MTRITNLGRKRTYLEAGFGKADASEEQKDDALTVETSEPVGAGEGDHELPPKKKPRKRRKKGKSDVPPEGSGEKDEGKVESERPSTKKGKKSKRGEEKRARAAASELRRQKRIAEREEHTTCLGCRKQGHTVKDCPEARIALHEDDADAAGAPGRSAVGICYRCGNKKHNLSRCKQPANPANPLPFASCFVCSGKGHLASSCPKNRGRGIYPNGGSCKLCGQTSHLAKDCELRSQENVSKSAVLLGSAHSEGGADEDDFHVLKRRRDAVQKEEVLTQRTADIPVVLAPKSKPKVVIFQ